LASLLEAKLLGIIGSVLVLFTIAPYAGPLLGIVGTGMVLLAVRDISKVFRKRSIFAMMIASIASLIIAVVIALITETRLAVQAFEDGPIVEVLVLLTRLAAAGSHLRLDMHMTEYLMLSWSFLIAAALFGMISYRKIASITKVGLFREVGQFYLYGSLTLAILIGLFFVVAAQMILMAAFLWLPGKMPKMAVN
jgi:uncharacterized membrane protein